MSSSRERWRRKFAAAFSGLFVSLREQSSFQVHILATVLVVAIAAALQVASWRWSVLLLTIVVVWSAELMNTAVEILAKKLHPERDPQIGYALDVAAAAVLVAASGSVVIGLVVLGPPLWNAVAG